MPYFRLVRVIDIIQAVRRILCMCRYLLSVAAAAVSQSVGAFCCTAAILPLVPLPRFHLGCASQMPWVLCVKRA